MRLSPLRAETASSKSRVPLRLVWLSLLGIMLLLVVAIGAGLLTGIFDTGDLGARLFGRAQPFKIAFVSDTETLSRWDELLQFIDSEGAEALLVQGDYLSGKNPRTLEFTTFEDWAGPEDLSQCDSRLLKGTRCILGPDFPILGPAIGKDLPEPFEHFFLETATRIEEQGGSWGGCIMDGEKGTPGVRMDGCGTDDNLANARAADYWVRWRGVTMVFQNAMPDTQWVPEVLQDDENIWKLCLWHGNHLDFQTGVKGHGYDGRDHSLPYELYQACADYGAIVINGNEHTYSRTCVMENIGNHKNGGPSRPNRVNRDPGAPLENHDPICPHAGASNDVAKDAVEQLEIGPGRTFVVVSAVAGYSWDEYLADVPSLLPEDHSRHANDGWWATIFTSNRYCRNNCTKADLSGQNPDAFVPGMNPPMKGGTELDPYVDAHGALFIEFNYKGDPYKAHGYFKKMFPDPDTGRQIVDEFIITYKP